MQLYVNVNSINLYFLLIIFILGKNGATCSSETGQCFCAPGWEGQYCDRPCNAESYGLNCGQKCNCKNGAACNPENGIVLKVLINFSCYLEFFF